MTYQPLGQGASILLSALWMRDSPAGSQPPLYPSLLIIIQSTDTVLPGVLGLCSACDQGKLVYCGYVVGHLGFGLWTGETFAGDVPTDPSAAGTDFHFFNSQ